MMPDAHAIFSMSFEVLASVSSLIASRHSLGSDHVNPKEIGQAVTAYMVHKLRRGIAAREALGPDRFFDVKYKELIADPTAMVRRIYNFLEFPFTGETEALLAAWIEDDRRQRRRFRHVYAPATFGLDAGVVQSTFREYTEWFGVPVQCRTH